MYSVAGRPAVVLIVNLYQSAHVLSRSRVSYCCVSVHSSARPASQMPPNYADSVVCAVCWIKHLLSRTGVKSRVRVSKDAAALWDPPDASRPTLDRHSQLFCVIFRWAVREAKFKGETEKCGSKWVKRGRCSKGILRRNGVENFKGIRYRYPPHLKPLKFSAVVAAMHVSELL